MSPDAVPKATQNTRHYVREVTDDSIRLVSTGIGASKTCYHASHHGKPACGHSSPKGSIVRWSPEKARVWRSACSYCFPNGDTDE